MSQFLIELNLPTVSSTDAANKFTVQSGDRAIAVRRLMNLFRGVVGGYRKGQLDYLAGATQGSGTLTLASVVSTNTCVVGLVTYTAGTSYAVGGTDTITAANLAAAINADANQAGIVTATSSATVVTVTAYPAGLIGNTIILTGSATITASGAHLASGANGTKRTFKYGL